jgi:hypothetical protein
LNKFVKLDLSAVKKICLNKSKNSFFIDIEKPEFSFCISKIHDSSKESICFLMAGNVHHISLSRALMETHCLRKTRYFNISILVLLQNNFSKFIMKKEINPGYFIKIFYKNTRQANLFICIYVKLYGLLFILYIL